MADLKIRVFKKGRADPSTTVSIPAGILKIAANLIPRRAKAALEDEGIDVEEIARLSDNPDAHGVIADIEDHDKGERVVLAFE